MKHKTLLFYKVQFIAVIICYTENLEDIKYSLSLETDIANTGHNHSANFWLWLVTETTANTIIYILFCLIPLVP